MFSDWEFFTRVTKKIDSHAFSGCERNSSFQVMELAAWSRSVGNEFFRKKVTDLYKNFELYLNGTIGDAMLFIALGDGKQKLYLAHEHPLTESQKNAVERVLQVKIVEVDDNIKVLEKEA